MKVKVGERYKLPQGTGIYMGYERCMKDGYTTELVVEDYDTDKPLRMLFKLDPYHLGAFRGSRYIYRSEDIKPFLSNCQILHDNLKCHFPDGWDIDIETESYHEEWEYFLVILTHEKTQIECKFSGRVRSNTLTCEIEIRENVWKSLNSTQTGIDNV
jgi:hypothetical protein